MKKKRLSAKSGRACHFCGKACHFCGKACHYFCDAGQKSQKALGETKQ